MFGSWQKSVKQKPLKDANFCLSMFMYINVCIWYVYTPAEADVPKLSCGCVRPKIKDAAVVYWQLNV